MAILRVVPHTISRVLAPKLALITGTVEDASTTPAAREVIVHRNKVDFGIMAKTTSNPTTGAYSLTVSANPGDSFRVEAIGAAGENTQVLDGIVPIPAA